ncbi:MAG: preprotein translocase subunit YajC [Agathobacter sp.]|nr:preprotein translocase subunit YajC [Agathobacter sp.]
MNTILLSGDAQAASGSNMLFAIILWVVVIAVFYFFMIRPQKKEEQKKQLMLSEVVTGDTVLTTAGFYGTIIDIPDDDTVIVEFGNNKNCRIPMKKSSIVELEHVKDSVGE